MHFIYHLPHRLRKTPHTFNASLTEEYPQRDVITLELGTGVFIKDVQIIWDHNETFNKTHRRGGAVD